MNSLKILLLVIEPGFIIGAAGMAASFPRVTADVRKARMLKFAGYFLIVHGIILACFWGGMVPGIVFGLITGAGMLELILVTYRNWEKKEVRKSWSKAILIYLVLGGITAACAFFWKAENLIYCYAVTAVLDAFCQIAGQLLGRNKLAPAISPAKTVEGLAGGIIFALLAAVILRGPVGLNIGQAIMAGAVISFAGVAGDLCASWYKRRCGVKDYSRWLPGQGGFIDRFNSIIAAVPAAGLLFFLVK